MIKRVLCLVLFALFSVPASAQVRTFVSTQGVDNSSCSRTNPCRTFSAAIAEVQSGGEVVALDSGGYGPVTINQAVSIIAPAGVYAAVAHTTGSAFAIDATETSDVLLRNLHVTALGGNYGIHATTFRSLSIESCSVAYAIVGINIETILGGRTAFISDSNVRNGSDGIRASATFGRVEVIISRTRSNQNGSLGAGGGFNSGNGSDMVCVDCEAGQNGTGFWAVSDFGTSASEGSTLSCERCTASLNNSGFVAAHGVLRLARSAALLNAYSGIRQDSGGAIVVLPNTNILSGNGFDRVPASGTVILSTPDNP